MQSLDRQTALVKAREYIRHQARIKELGHGINGFVFSVEANSGYSALKVVNESSSFARELAVYQHLRECRVRRVLGLAVPELIGWDTTLRIIEMTVVTPPFLLDFANATLFVPDQPIETDDEMWERFRPDFGDDLEAAQDVVYYLREHYDIYYYDIAPRNIRVR